LLIVNAPAVALAPSISAVIAAEVAELVVAQPASTTPTKATTRQPTRRLGTSGGALHQQREVVLVVGGQGRGVEDHMGLVVAAERQHLG
jgi:hypothetical protein